ncbi:type II 3-dehydroquinate dehydratase [Dyella soli]|uniref:3-dehydroquinate dehydratase n=1 Tax=Dyella soli TaxID=522319 RepID=A0A4V2NLQ4_9GAMM|nr:type II 3-dehydroquinate dehydratase [Dyella soli]TCI10071.1 type II 3-dehydroquinate dehydratase [Dyella soli]
MSILIVHGPHAAGHSPTQDLLRQLQQQAHAAGRMLELRTCGDLRDFVVQVCAANSDRTDMVLLDPGDLSPQIRAHPEAGLADALDQLDAPYIEVHEAFGAELERGASIHHAPVATVIINGNIASSYRIGLSIALRQLAADHRRNDGTPVQPNGPQDSEVVPRSSVSG